MNPVYTFKQLEAKKRPQLWAICEALGLPKHASNAKCVEAIFQVQPLKIETETLITTESVNDATVVYANNNPIAAIAYNDTDSHLTHPWVVMIGGIEIHATNTWAHAYSYITWHHKQGTLPSAQPQPIDEQTVAQTELNTYIQEQAQDIAPSIQVLEQHGDKYVVVNLENGNHYVVCPSHPDRQQRCECPHCYYRGAKCKHQQVVQKLALKSAVVVAGIALSAVLVNPLAAVASNTEPSNNGHSSSTKVVSDCTYRGVGRREDCFKINSDRPTMTYYENCEIKYNPETDEYLAFDENGESGCIYLGGGCGADGEQKAKKAIDDYLEWKDSLDLFPQ